MTRARWASRAGTCVACAAAVALQASIQGAFGAGTEEAPPVRALEGGFEWIFNGTDLSGWVFERGEKPSFDVDRAGNLHCTGAANYPAWLRTEAEYENFILRFDYKMPYYTESGVFLHAPLHGRLSDVGLQLKLSEDSARGSKVQHTGAIVGVAQALAVGARGRDTWNAMEIVMDWPRLEARVNDVVVQQVDLAAHPELRYRWRRGYLGLADAGSEVWFRNLRLRALPAGPRPVPLFDGASFSGWRRIGEAAWEIRGGALHAANGNGYLLTDAEYQDFALHLFVRTSRLANGGIFVRWKTESDRGYEIQIYSNPDGDNPTGSIYSEVRGSVLPIGQGEDWFPMQIVLEGGRCVSRVNGVTVAEATGLETVRPGSIGLQMHRRDAWIEFKDLELWPLGASAARE